MFNEGNSYGTYETMFTKNSKYPGSSVQEIMNLGVSYASLVVAKPVIQSIGTVHDGYVDAISLGQWACSASSNFGWNDGFTAWTWNSKDEYNVLDWPGDLSSQC